ncbi:MAG: hypothetical protein NTU95_05970 [Methanothrix sp.]|nr:hypothetical protein [Methanothrix sp.]
MYGMTRPDRFDLGKRSTGGEAAAAWSDVFPPSPDSTTSACSRTTLTGRSWPRAMW